MGHLANGDGGVGDGSKKRIFENGGFMNAPVLKFKKRRISAIRDFPPGCGRNAILINGRLRENGGGGIRLVENSEDEGEGEGEGVRVESNSNSVVRNFPEGCGHDLKLEEENDGKSDGLEDAVVVEQKAANEGDLPQLSKPLVEETTKPVEIIEVPAIFIPKPSVSESVEVISPISVDVEEETSLKKFPLRGRVSAVRNFPPGCGWGAAPVNQKDGNKSVDASKNKDVGSKKHNGANAIANAKIVEESVGRDIVKSKLIERKEAEDDVKLDADKGSKKEVAQQVYVQGGGSNLEQGNTQKSGSELLPEKGLEPPRASPVGEKINKPATGSVKLSKDMNYKRTFPEKSISDSHVINQSPGKPNFALGFAEDRDVVQCLMAKPKCPWGQGKKLLSPAVGVDSPVKKGKKTLKTPSSIPSSVEQGKKTSISPTDVPSSNVVERAGSPSCDDREIVLSLMAAKCPWKPGKKPSKSPSSQAKKSVAK